MKQGIYIGIAIAALSLSANAAMQTYNGLGNGATTGPIVGGNLQISGNVGTDISFTYNRGQGSLTAGRFVVLFLDSTAGGYGNTASFTDIGINGRSAISGLSSSGARATATFATGFTADYALVINPEYGVTLWQLGTGEFTRLRQPFLGGVASSTTTYDFNLRRGELGMGASDSLRFQSAFVSEEGGRVSLESFESVTGALYFGNTQFGFFNAFDVQPVPEMSNLALAVFGCLAVSGSLVIKVRRYLHSRKISAG